MPGRKLSIGTVARVRRGLPHDLVDVARGVAGVAAVEHDEQVAAGRRDLRDEDRQLLVGEVPAAWLTAVDEDERLVLVVGLVVPQLLRRILVRAVPAVVEERDVLCIGLPEVAANSLVTVSRVASSSVTMTMPSSSAGTRPLRISPKAVTSLTHPDRGGTTPV